MPNPRCFTPSYVASRLVAPFSFHRVPRELTPFATQRLIAARLPLFLPRLEVLWRWKSFGRFHLSICFFSSSLNEGNDTHETRWDFNWAKNIEQSLWRLFISMFHRTKLILSNWIFATKSCLFICLFVWDYFKMIILTTESLVIKRINIVNIRSFFFFDIVQNFILFKSRYTYWFWSII